MRKALLLLMIIAFSLLSCQNEANAPETPEAASAAFEPAETAPPKASETAEKTAVGVPADQDVTRADIEASPSSTPSEMATVEEEAATPTALPPTATPDHPPADHVNVPTVEKAPSECSPDYPCNSDVEGWESRMRVPPDFEITYFARVGGKPTAMTVGPDGNLYVAVVTGTIYTVDSEGSVEEFYSGLKTPTGLAFPPGSDRLYVSSRLVDDYVSGEGQVGYIENGQHKQILNGLPCCYIGMHGPNGIAFGADGYGYVGVGGRADHGEILLPPNDGEQDELHPLEASIIRFSPDGQEISVYARGFRNPYDLTWDAEGRLYATDNGRDGSPEEDSVPPDELHEVIPAGEHGYPYFECPNCFGIPDDIQVIEPLHELIPHGAVTGITTYLHDAFPGYYNDLFLVLWSAFEGAQKVQRVGRDRTEISDFATGFAAPIDIVVGPDGDLFIADFATGIIFRISYIGDQSTSD